MKHTILTTELNHFDRTLHLFDGRTNGAFSYKCVLDHHKKVQEYENEIMFGMPAMDGVVHLCEHPNIETINRRIEEFSKEISALQEGMKGQAYIVWTTLDKACYRKQCRLQLLNLCKNEYHKNLKRFEKELQEN